MVCFLGPIAPRLSDVQTKVPVNNGGEGGILPIALQLVTPLVDPGGFETLQFLAGRL